MKNVIVLLCAVITVLSCSSDNGAGDPPDDGLANIIMSPITSIEMFSAMARAEITDNGGTTILSRGFCWSTNVNPSVNDNVVDGSSGDFIYEEMLRNLEAQTTYYVRAFVVNAEGISYSSEVSFSTLLLP